MNLKKWSVGILIFIFAFMIFVMSSCVNQRSVARWIEKNGGSVTIDSTFVVDTLQFITQKVETDTVFSIHRKDTMIIHKENLTIKTYFRNDSIFVYGECESDTVTIIQERWVGNQLSVAPKKDLTDWIQFIMVAVCGVAAIYILLIKKK